MTKQELKSYVQKRLGYSEKQVDEMSSIELLESWCLSKNLIGGWAYSVVSAVEAAFGVHIMNEDDDV